MIQTNSFLFKFLQISIAHLCKILQIVFIQNDFQIVINVENVFNVLLVMNVIIVKHVSIVIIVAIVLIVHNVKIVNIVFLVKTYRIKCL